MGAPRAATTALEQAVKLEPKWGDGWLLLGGAHMMANKLDEAVSAYQKAVEADPTNARSRRLLARALSAKRRDAEAIKAWQEVLKLDPEDEQSTKRVTTLLLRAHRYSEVLVYLLSAEEEHQESAAYELAEAKKHMNEALKYAQDAVKQTEEQSGKDESLDTSNLVLMANLAARWDTLGWVHFQMGDYAGATKYLESAWALMQDPIVGDHLGQLYEKTGKKQQAARMYSMVLSAMGSNGDPALKQQISAKLKTLAASGIRGSKDADEELSALRTYHAVNPKPWGRRV